MKRKNRRNTVPKPGFIIDMDGVIYRGRSLIPGAREFVHRLKAGGRPFVFLTNNSEQTPEQLQRKLRHMGMRIPVEHFFTSSMATAKFLRTQRARGRAYVIGGQALKRALQEIGYTLTALRPHYVVVGNPVEYNYLRITKAVNLIRHGARFIGTNPDLTGPTETGIAPGCGALVAPIQLATGHHPYFIGKPNPLMVRMALRYLNLRSSNAYIVGDRMDTDIQAGLETGMQTILVLSGVTSRHTLKKFAYRPHHVFAHAGQIPVRRLKGRSPSPTP